MGNSLDTEGSRQFLQAGSILFDFLSEYSIGFIAIFVLLILSGLISGSEVAFFSLSHDDVKALSQDEKKNDKLIIKLLNTPKKLLASILIANNLVNVGIVTIFTFLTLQYFSPEVPDKETMFYVSLVVTFLLVFFGEVIPKVYATKNQIFFARNTANLLNVCNKIFNPVAVILLGFSNLIERRIEKKKYNVSVEEINQALDIATTEETTEGEKDILKGIVNFGTISTKQIMKSRLEITAFENDMNFHQLMDKINKSGYSRIPVYKETIDKIIGVLYTKDLLPFVENNENFKWQKLLRPAYFTSESKKIDDLLKIFQEKRVHMAIVVDEYGGTSGVITLEDIIEEIVGEINDEFDAQEIDYTKVDENIFLFEGKTSLNDLVKILDVRFDVFDEAKGESESLAGLILELNSSLPKVGEEIVFENFTFNVEAVNAKRIKRIRVTVNEEVDEES